MFIKLWEEHPGALLGILFGTLAGVIFLLVGFWKTLIFVSFIGLGLFIGKRFDQQGDLRSVLEEILPDKFFK